MKRSHALAAAMALAACAPPAPSNGAAPTPAPPVAQDTTAQAVLAALTPLFSSEIGQDVNLQADTLNVIDDWAFVHATTRQADGAPMDWTKTNLASRYENGAMDEGGGAYALLKRENGAWRVLEHVIAPTDVAWLDWPARHGAPATIIEQPASP